MRILLAPNVSSYTVPTVLKRMYFNEAINKLLIDGEIESARIEWDTILEYLTEAGTELNAAKQNFPDSGSRAFSALYQFGLALMLCQGFQPVSGRNENDSITRFIGIMLTDESNWILARLIDSKNKQDASAMRMLDDVQALIEEVLRLIRNKIPNRITHSESLGELLNSKEFKPILG